MVCNLLCYVAVAKCQPAQQQRWTNAQVRTFISSYNVFLCGAFGDDLGLLFRFVRRLLFFYKPSSKLYASLELDHSKAKHLTVVGCQFIEFLLESDEVREGKHSYSQGLFLKCLLIHSCLFNLGLFAILSHQDGQVYLEDLVKDIVQWLSSSSGLKPDRSLQSNGLLNTLSQHYFLFLGTLSAHPSGVKLLEKCSVFQWWVKSSCWSLMNAFC